MPLSQLIIYVDPAICAQVDARRGNRSRSDFLRPAILAYLDHPLDGDAHIRQIVREELAARHHAAPQQETAMPDHIVEANKLIDKAPHHATPRDDAALRIAALQALLGHFTHNYEPRASEIATPLHISPQKLASLLNPLGLKTTGKHRGRYSLALKEKVLDEIRKLEPSMVSNTSSTETDI